VKSIIRTRNGGCSRIQGSPHGDESARDAARRTAAAACHKENVHPECRAEGGSERCPPDGALSTEEPTRGSASYRRGSRFQARWPPLVRATPRRAAIRRCASSVSVGRSVCASCTVARTHPAGRLRARSRAHPLARLDECQQQFIGRRGDAVALAGRDDPPRDGVDLRSACAGVRVRVRASTASVTVMIPMRRRRAWRAYLDPRRRSDSMEQMFSPVLLATRSTSSSSSWARSERGVSL
jgi:hypothetical protein